MNRLRCFLLVVLTAAMTWPAAARAQSLPPPPAGPTEDPAETARVKIGPFFMQPAFGLKNVGLDNNVYNDPANPVQDWTGTVSLGMLAGLRFGPARLTVKTNTDYIYYAEEKTERSIDGLTRYQFEVRTSRIRPWIAYEASKTHERAGFEIDARAGREMPVYEAGVEYKIGFRLATRLVGRKRSVEFESEETFRGVALGEALNSTTEEGAVQLLYEISPLSSLRASAELARTRFDTATVRDAKDRAVFIGLEGRRDAGIEGHVDVGWRERTPEDPAAPAYSGLVARASAAVILWESVRVAFGAERDIPWSYEDFYTFYVQQGGSSTVTWRPYQRFEIVGTGRHYWLDYEQGVDPRAVLRTDKIYGYGGGFGFFLTGYPGTRLGVMVERTVRESVIPDRAYDTPRYYTTVGFSF